VFGTRRAVTAALCFLLGVQRIKLIPNESAEHGWTASLIIDSVYFKTRTD
jgi:hypothetical protein